MSCDVMPFDVPLQVFILIYYRLLDKQRYYYQVVYSKYVQITVTITFFHMLTCTLNVGFMFIMQHTIPSVTVFMAALTWVAVSSCLLDGGPHKHFPANVPTKRY